MTRLVISPKATADFSGILDRLTELAGVSVAERYTRDLKSIYRRLARFPEIGAPRPRLGASTRIIVLQPFLVIYDYTSDDDIVNVVRIVDGRRNITRRLIRE